MFAYVGMSRASCPSSVFVLICFIKNRMQCAIPIWIFVLITKKKIYTCMAFILGSFCKTARMRGGGAAY
jgi:hypothetical protein